MDFPGENVLGQSIYEALRLHSESLTVNLSADAESDAQTARVMRRRSNSLCLHATPPYFVLEPCLETSSQEDCCTTTSSSVNDCEMSLPAFPPQTKVTMNTDVRDLIGTD